MAKPTTPLRRVLDPINDFAVRALPDVVEGPLRRFFNMAPMPTPQRFAVPRAPLALPAPPKRLALPAPPKVLALPAPGPKLPPHAAKPRGGQFYPDAPIGATDAQAAGYMVDNWVGRSGEDLYGVFRPDGTPVSGYHASTPEGAWNLADVHYRINSPASNKSPEAAARMAREEYGLSPYHEDGRPEPQAQLGDWLERTLAKYYKTDFGSPNDPLRDLAERGLHYDPTMTPERWQQAVNDVLTEDPIGYFTVPRHENEIRAGLAGAPENFSFLGSHDPVGQGALMQAAPWLRKQPVTDMLYGVRDSLDLGHFVDEMGNAMDPRSGLPMDLAVRPESLGRMTFAQAAEHVGKINRFRVKEMERAALDAQNNPVTHVFKEYADDNPTGLRWVEMAPPKGDGSTNYDVEEELGKALKYEGDTMGHCVGGYCPDVMSGKSRIFSLRDAKGEPHVTVETSPGRPRTALSEIPRDALDQITAAAKADTDQVTGPMGIGMDDPRWTRTYQTNLGLKQREWLSANPTPDDIIQIKGKQNRAPKDDYLPFVQDFVKSGQWGNVGDLANSGLVRLPDGRYLTQQQYDEGLNAAASALGTSSPETLTRLVEWPRLAPHFEGYAIGGRVDADRCFCHNPLSVKRG